jgi:hypothetical protein
MMYGRFTLQPLSLDTPIILQQVRNGGWIVEVGGLRHEMSKTQGAFTTTQEMLNALSEALIVSPAPAPAG